MRSSGASHARGATRVMRGHGCPSFQPGDGQPTHQAKRWQRAASGYRQPPKRRALVGRSTGGEGSKKLRTAMGMLGPGFQSGAEYRAGQPQPASYACHRLVVDCCRHPTKIGLAADRVTSDHTPMSHRWLHSNRCQCQTMAVKPARPSELRAL